MRQPVEVEVIQPQAVLSEAARLIESVMAGLDLTEIHCQHCSRFKRRNWDEAQMHKELEAIVRKLKRFGSKSDCKEVDNR